MIDLLSRSHADVLCDGMIEAEADIMQLLARFPGVDFEQKEPEIGNTWFAELYSFDLGEVLKFMCLVCLFVSSADPYASTKGWVGRRTRPQVDGVDPDSPSSPNAYSATDHTHSAGYLYGSPSERFPMLDRSALSEQDEDSGSSDTEDEGPLEDGTGEGHDSSEEEEKRVRIKVDLESVNDWNSSENMLHNDNS